MSAKHTAGVIHVVGRNKCAVMTEPGQDCRTVAHAIQPEDARRLAACWNACEGISTELLEAAPYKDSAAFMAFLKVESQRDELLAALRQITELHGQWNNGIWASLIASDAIAKATGADRQSTDDKLREEYRVGFDAPPAD